MNPEVKLFKYLDVEGVTATLRDGTILFTSPIHFNDPFDISIQTLFAYDLFDLEAHLDEFVNLALSRKPFPEGNGSEIASKFLKINSVLSKEPEEYRKTVRSQLMAGGMWNLESLRKSYDEMFFQIKTAFEASGIFCASKRFDNYLLWAHYAQHHQGAVLEFVPDLEKDSILRLAEKVKYTDGRPHLYESRRDYLMKAMFQTTTDILRDYAKRITATKSLEWSYEEELRVYYPMCVNIFEGKRHHTQIYHDDELRKVYLGCKMTQANRLNVIDLATRRNPDAEIYEMVADPHQYRLEAKRIR